MHSKKEVSRKKIDFQQFQKRYRLQKLTFFGRCRKKTAFKMDQMFNKYWESWKKRGLWKKIEFQLLLKKLWAPKVENLCAWKFRSWLFFLQYGFWKVQKMFSLEKLRLWNFHQNLSDKINVSINFQFF